MLPQPQTKRPQTKGKTSWGQVIGLLLTLLAIIGGVSYGAFVVASPFGWLAHTETRLAAFLIGARVGELAALGVLTWWLRRRGSSRARWGSAKRRLGAAWRWAWSWPSSTAGSPQYSTPRLARIFCGSPR